MSRPEVRSVWLNCSPHCLIFSVCCPQTHLWPWKHPRRKSVASASSQHRRNPAAQAYTAKLSWKGSKSSPFCWTARKGFSARRRRKSTWSSQLCWRRTAGPYLTSQTLCSLQRRGELPPPHQQQSLKYHLPISLDSLYHRLALHLQRTISAKKVKLKLDELS